MRPLALATCMILFGIFGTAVAQTPAAPAQPAAPVQAAAAVQPDKNSPDYRTGMNDGCMHATFGQPRNDTRYRNDAAYHLGWDVGFRNCYPHQTLNTNNDPNGPLKF